MVNRVCNVPIPKNSQELEQAIQQYRTGDLKGFDLFCQWQAIRDVSLEQAIAESQADVVPGEQSY